ncbi:HIT domain-containing protein [Helicobacter muridarum]|uniref:HIT domain-containing protein n=1 Tax=Helicobacter muridarum TaxID=216 RepID=A0A099U0B4_9HELI|nr:HIT domain-containing protein [Helicobacter muridarum]TLE00834.1 HIT domain-containing protein [Helicobacter muridarum]STQ86598.1 histidine triad family protein [Helicobacter muridarum]
MYNNIYSPWRSPYFSSIDNDICVFCNISKQIFNSNSINYDNNCANNEHNINRYSLPKKYRNIEIEKELYVFYNDSLCFGVMNLYPYTPGHFMLIPHSHVDSPSLLSQEIWLHINGIGQRAIAMLEEYGASGINMGINIRQAAGAGIPKHLHLHFVPRFESDTNFITVIGNTRVYGIEFKLIFDKITKLAEKYLY